MGGARGSIPHAVACERPPIPGVVAKNAVGFGDDVPPLDIVKIGSIGAARFDVLLPSSLALNCLTWVSLSAITWSSR